MHWYNAKKETFELCKICGLNALFTSMRMDRTSIPDGMICYEVRHDEKGNPIQIAKDILVDHFGSILTEEPFENLERFDNGYLDIDYEKDWEWVFEAPMTIEEYRRRKI